MSIEFSNLHLRNWKNFVQVDVDIGNRLFLVGPNASGKSNFLDVFRFLRDLAVSGGGFQEAISKRGGVSAIRCLAARRYPDVEIHVALRGDVDSPSWEYEFATSHWRPDAASRRSESLQRAIACLLRLLVAA
jgi:predicted ATPase